jgi:glucose/mannose transport system substrate-binding protein
MPSARAAAMPAIRFWEGPPRRQAGARRPHATRARSATAEVAAADRLGRTEAGWYYRGRRLGTSMRSRINSWCGGWVAFAALTAGLALTLPACGGSQGTSPVEILHWWKQGGEAQAIGALLAEFKRQNPSVKIVDSSVDGSSLARAAIRNRMSIGNPPDTFQANGGWDLMTWVLYLGSNADQTKMQGMEPSTLEWFENVPKPVRDSVSYNGMVYAVPLNIHRLNTFFYNKDVFAMLNIDASQLTSLDAMFAAAEKVNQYNQQQMTIDPNAKQITPIALGYRATEGDTATNDSWTLALLFFENILVARMGGAAYQDLFLNPKKDFADPTMDDAFSPAMTNALGDFRKLVVSYSNSNAPSLTWSQPLDMVLSGDAAMTIMGDWGKGYADAALKAAGKTEKPYGVIPTPGTAGTFVFTTDTFGMPIGAPDGDNTRKLLDLFGSQEGQDIFNPIKGSISARTDSNIDSPAYDEMAKQTFNDFLNADLIVPATSILAQPVYVDAISGALADFAKDRANGNPSIVQHTLDNYADILRSSCWPVCQPAQ